MQRPLIRVHLWSGLRSLVGGVGFLEVRAATIGQMLEALVAEHPALGPQIDDDGVSVSVNGRIHAFGLTEALDETQEIWLLQRIRGG